MSMPSAALAGGRAARALAVPEGVLLAALLAVPFFDASGPITRYASLLAGTAALVATLVAWRFGRGRIVLALVVVALAATLPLLGSATARTAGAALVAADLVLLSLLPERPVLSWSGGLRTAVLGLQAAFVAWLALPDTAFEVPATVVTRVGTIDVSTAAYATAILLLAVGVLRRDAPVRRGLLWAAVAALAVHLGTPGGMAWQIFAGIAVLLAAALEEAHRLAFQDALTGLPSRRALEERLRRLRGRYTVAMVDVDHFKKFNDRHGHDVGDQVLRMVATRLRETPGARAFRYGGEEFTLLFPGKSQEEVRDRLEDARRRVGERDFTVRGPDRPPKKPRRILFPSRPRQKLSVSVSVGAAERGHRRQTPAEVLAQADEALYEAKREGRNRVVA